MLGGEKATSYLIEKDRYGKPNKGSGADKAETTDSMQKLNSLRLSRMHMKTREGQMRECKETCADQADRTATFRDRYRDFI